LKLSDFFESYEEFDRECNKMFLKFQNVRKQEYELNMGLINRNMKVTIDTFPVYIANFKIVKIKNPFMIYGDLFFKSTAYNRLKWYVINKIEKLKEDD